VLPSLTELCQGQYLRKYGALGIAVVDESIHILTLDIVIDNPDKNTANYGYARIDLNNDVELSVVLSDYLLQHNMSKRLTYLSLDSQYIDIQSMLFDTLPNKDKERERFIGWRFGKELRRSFSAKIINFNVQAPTHFQPAALVNLVSAEPQLVKSLEGLANEFDLCLQSLRAIDLCFPPALAHLIPLKTNSTFTALCLTVNRWAIIVGNSQGECQYHRSRTWIGGQTSNQQLNRLAADIEGVFERLQVLKALPARQVMTFGDKELLSGLAASVKESEIELIAVDRDIAKQLPKLLDSHPDSIFPLVALLADGLRWKI